MEIPSDLPFPASNQSAELSSKPCCKKTGVEPRGPGIRKTVRI